MTRSSSSVSRFTRPASGHSAQGRRVVLGLVLGGLLAALLWYPSATLQAQDRSPSPGGSAGPASSGAEWRAWGADPASTRYSSLEQVDASNFEDLEVAWIWRGDNFGPPADTVYRATPIYADGRLYTVAGRRRTVVAIDPATGETLWTFREPHTERWARSPRQNHGKGVAYGEVDGRGVIYYVSPGFFLHALDAETGRPLEGFGGEVPIEGFADEGTVDLIDYLQRVQDHDPYVGVPPEQGNITSSSPALVVDGVVIVGSSAEQGLGYSRLEQVPGDILAFDAATGEHLWTFYTVPRPGQVGHDTWESDAWAYSGNVNAWAPLSADPERGIVYVPTDAPTNDAYGGFRPGDNLFGTSVLALDVHTGERVWHFQTVHHDVWDYDNPVAPIVLDLTVDGERVPAVLQATKQGLVFAFHRETGDPIWPIPEVSVPPSEVPGEQLSPTQPIPSRPAPFAMQGITTDDLVDFTPELNARAREAVADLKMGPLYNPPLHRDNDEGFRGSLMCPGVMGGMDIMGGAAADPETGTLYVASVRSCFINSLVPGSEVDEGEAPAEPGDQPGTTVVDWVQGRPEFLGSIEGIPILAPPYGRITAIDMNTGEHLWWIPNGDTPERIAQHPLLDGVDVPNTGQPSHATTLVTRSLLMYGEGRRGRPLFHAVDKRTGDRIGTVDIPAPTTTAPMTYMHEGRQYVALPVAGNGHVSSLVVLALP